MSFIRTKKIGGSEYAYLVENKWYKRRFKSKNKGCRQRVSKYLGKVYYFSKTNEISFLDYGRIDDLELYLKNPRDKVIRELISWEIFRHNIDGFLIDFDRKKVIKGKKEVSLRINEGFLNSFTLKRLFELKSVDGYYLAKCFVDAGVEIPKEVFVGLFGR